MSMVIEATDDTFQSIVIDSPKLTVVDFWADWCVPCKKIAPILEEIATEMSESLLVVKINIDNHPKVSSSYGIMSIPALLMFQEGELVCTLVGAMPKSRLLERIKEYI